MATGNTPQSVQLPPQSRIVRIPGGLRHKLGLMAELAARLQFPPYFGWNWDALEDCLRDLSWLGPVTQVVLIHDDIPLVPGSADQLTYREILTEVAHDSQQGPGPQLVVVFPESAQPEA